MRRRTLDLSAVGLSTLCLAHCLALPLFVSVSPLMGALAGNELAHALFVAVAAPVSAMAFSHPRPRRARPWWLPVSAIGAIGLLLLGVVGWPREDWEVPLTVAGALALAAVHIINWRRYGTAPARPAVR